MESITITQVNFHEFKALIEEAVRDALKSKAKDTDEFSGGGILTVPQAAELLHLAVPTIYGLLHRRELPSMKRGNRVYFKRSELMQYLEQGRKKTSAEIQNEAGLSILPGKKRRR